MTQHSILFEEFPQIKKVYELQNWSHNSQWDLSRKWENFFATYERLLAKVFFSAEVLPFQVFRLFRVLVPILFSKFEASIAAKTSQLFFSSCLSIAPHLIAFFSYLLQFSFFARVFFSLAFASQAWKRLKVGTKQDQEEVRKNNWIRLHGDVDTILIE